MLHKNVLPLPKRITIKNTSDCDTVEQAALNALSGLFCSVCDAPLCREDRMINGSARPHTAYVCCKTAHCPFCGTSGKQRCEHLAAYRTSGDWRIAGLPDLAGHPVPEAIPLTTETLQEYSDEQKQEAFGQAFQLLFSLYGPGLRRNKEAELGGRLLIDALVPAENKQHPGDGTEYYFCRNVTGSAESVRLGLTDGLTNGFSRLQSFTPPGARFAIGTLMMKTEIRAVAFAPCGTRFVVCDLDSCEIRRINNGDMVLHTGWTNPAQGRLYHRATFTPSGKKVVLLDGHPYFETDYTTEFRDAHTGDRILGIEQSHMNRIHRLPEELDENREIFDTTRETFLHNGATYMTVRGRCIRFYDVASTTGDIEPLLTITLRLPVAHFAVSPDGETFVTAAGQFMTLWQVTREALCKEKEGVG